MTPKQFNKWLSEMRRIGVKTDTECAKILGISRRTMLRYKQEGAGLTVSLACNSLIQKLGPYK